MEKVRGAKEREGKEEVGVIEKKRGRRNEGEGRDRKLIILSSQAVERAKEIIAGLDTQKESVVVEEMAVGGNSKVRLCPLTPHSSCHV